MTSSTQDHEEGSWFQRRAEGERTILGIEEAIGVKELLGSVETYGEAMELLRTALRGCLADEGKEVLQEAATTILTNLDLVRGLPQRYEEILAPILRSPALSEARLEAIVQWNTDQLAALASVDIFLDDHMTPERIQALKVLSPTDLAYISPAELLTTALEEIGQMTGKKGKDQERLRIQRISELPKDVKAAMGTCAKDLDLERINVLENAFPTPFVEAIGAEFILKMPIKNLRAILHFLGEGRGTVEGVEKIKLIGSQRLSSLSPESLQIIGCNVSVAELEDYLRNPRPADYYLAAEQREALGATITDLTEAQILALHLVASERIALVGADLWRQMDPIRIGSLGILSSEAIQKVQDKSQLVTMALEDIMGLDGAQKRRLLIGP